MMLSVMVVGAGAAFSDQSKIKNTEAVDACTALNIIGGYPDGSFKPEGNITRAEVTKMICVALNGGKNPAVSTNTTPTFSDVRNNANAAWAEGYIESCAAQGIVSGVGGGKFAPNGNVTGVQLAKMLLVSLGYKSENEGFTGNAWATNVNVRAAQKGLYEGLETMDTNAALTRDNAARMVWNALNAYEVEYKTTLVTDSKGQLTSQITVQDKVGIDNLSQKLTLLRDKYEAVIYEGTLKASGKYNAMNATGAGSDKLVVDVKYVDGTEVSGNFNNQALKCKKDFTDLLGQYVKVMYDTKDKTVYGVFPVADENTVITATMGDVDAVALGATKVKVDGTEYDLENAVAAADTNVYGAASDDFNTVFTGANSATKVKFISNDGNDKIDLAIVVPVNVYEITYVGSDNITLKNLNGAPALGNIKKSDCVISGDLAKDDYVSVIGKEYNFDGKYEVTKLTTTEGKTEQIKTASSATTDMKVGGTWYTLLSGLKDDNNNQIAVDTTYKFAAVDGYVYYAEKVSGGATKVALVTGVSSNTNFDGYVQTRLMLTDGTEITDYMGEIEKDSNRMENIRAGSLVAYEKDDDHYNLFLIGKDYADAKNDDKAKASYDSVVGVTSNTSTYNVNGTAWNKADKTVAGTKVNDSAVVFVASKKSASNNDVVYKVITGKQLNDWKTDFGTFGVGLKNNSGLGYLDVAYVTGTDAVTPNTTTKYAYVTSDIAAGTDFVTYSIWDGSSEKSIEVTEKVTSTNAAKNTVISFDWDGEGVVKNVEKVSDFGAIQYSNGKQVKINGKGYDLADDVTILNVDTDKKEGVPGTAINEAQKDSNGNYYCNAIYVYDAADDEIDLLVIDVKNNKWTGKSEVVTEGTTAAEINTALDAAGDNGTVVVTGTLPDSGVQALKAGQTLIVNAAQTVTALDNISGANGAKLVLNAASSNKTSAVSTKFFTATSTAVISGANIPAATYVSNGTQWVKQ